MQIFHERRQALIEHRHVLTATCEVAAVPVPAGEGQRHTARAGFHQTAGQQEIIE